MLSKFSQGKDASADSGLICCALSIRWVQSWKEPCYVSYLYKHYTAVPEIFQQIWALTDSGGLSCYQAWWCVLFCSLVRFGLLWHPIWPKQKQHAFSACRWSDKRLNMHAWLTGENSVEEDRTDLGGVGCIIMMLKGGKKNSTATCTWAYKENQVCFTCDYVRNMWVHVKSMWFNTMFFPETRACEIIWIICKTTGEKWTWK